MTKKGLNIIYSSKLNYVWSGEYNIYLGVKHRIILKVLVNVIIKILAWKLCSTICEMIVHTSTKHREVLMISVWKLKCQSERLIRTSAELYAVNYLVNRHAYERKIPADQPLCSWNNSSLENPVGPNS